MSTDGNHDARAPTVRRAGDDFNGVHDNLRSRMEDLSQTQRKIPLDACFEELSPDEIAARRGIIVNTFHKHRKAAFSKLRDSMMVVVDSSTDVDFPNWFDRVEAMNERYAARERRRESGE